jgi:predicted nucleic acid-binding protein
VIVVDTGPLVAIADADDQDHERCLAALAQASRPLLVPTTVLTEVCYLLERELGSHAEARFLRTLSRRTAIFRSVALTPPLWRLLRGSRLPQLQLSIGGTSA